MAHMKNPLKRIARFLERTAAGSPAGRAMIRRVLQVRGPECWGDLLLDRFVVGDAGAAYGLGAREKRELVAAFGRIAGSVQSGTSPLVHAALAEALLSLPRETRGDVVECGAWKGASTAALSLVCRATGRRLKVCDSFQGLPDEGLRRHTGLHTRVFGYYQPGMFAGTLEEVQEHVRRFGAPEVCDYIAGFFAESLRALRDPVAFAFVDVDLVDSTRDCLRAIWPLLAEDGLIYTDDAGDLEVVKVYFDEPWWQAELGCPAPGMVGSGCGLPLSPAYSSLGYTRKITAFREEAWRRVGFLHYPNPPA